MALKSYFLNGLIVILSGVFLSVSVAPSAAHAQDSFSEAQKAELQNLFKDYLMQNADVILESVQAYQIKKQQEEEQSAQNKLKDLLPTLKSGNHPSAGNPNGDVTIVEFFDYNCGYCKKALPDIQAVLAEDKNVHVVLIDIPVLGASSDMAARWSMAAQKQNKYFDYHVALMNFQGPKDEQTLSKLAADVGLDVEKLKQDASSESASKAIEANMKLAEDLGIRGTPGFIVGTDIYRGYIGEEAMMDAVKKARKK